VLQIDSGTRVSFDMHAFRLCLHFIGIFMLLFTSCLVYILKKDTAVPTLPESIIASNARICNGGRGSAD